MNNVSKINYVQFKKKLLFNEHSSLNLYLNGKIISNFRCKFKCLFFAGEFKKKPISLAMDRWILTIG